MRAKDVMTTPVVTVHPETSLKEVVRLLIEREISGVPVVNEAEELVGIVTEADLVALETTPDPRSQILRIQPSGRPIPQTAGQAMSEHVVALPEDCDSSHIARLMLEKGVKQIPIVSGTKVVGIVSRRDLLRVLARSDEEIRAEVEELLDDEILMLGRFGVEVKGGVATLRGWSSDRAGRRLAELLCRSVPGVLDVEFIESNP